jgi:hypothetical protein
VDYSLAGSAFDFWLMHTNFGLFGSIKNVIEKTPGVESIEVYTRYRARIGFPRSGLFQPRDVMHEIKKVVRQLDYDVQNQLLVGLDIDVAEQAIEIRDTLDKHNDHWALWVIPNGEIDTVCSEKEPNEQYNDKLKLLEQGQEAVGGRLLTSESE